MDVALRVHAWHQRSAPIDARERLLAAVTPAPTRVVLATCHRVEAYDVGAPPALAAADRASARVLTGIDAHAHLVAVCAGLDSQVAGEPQILAQVRRAYVAQRPAHPLLAAAFEHALYAGRAVRRASGVSSSRSVGSLAVEELVRRCPRPEAARVLVIGAGEMGKLAVRALARRVGGVAVANRDIERAREVAAANGAVAVELADVPRMVGAVDAVISAADTRGALLTAALLRRRIARGPFVLIDIAVPRSVGAEGRALLGDAYLSVDDLAADDRVPSTVLAAARARCRAEAERFVTARAPERVAAIRALRDDAERLRAEKVRRAMRKLGHLSERDRRVVEMLSTRLTNALLHRPTVELRGR